MNRTISGNFDYNAISPLHTGMNRSKAYVLSLIVYYTLAHGDESKIHDLK